MRPRDKLAFLLIVELERSEARRHGNGLLQELQAAKTLSAMEQAPSLCLVLDLVHTLRRRIFVDRCNISVLRWDAAANGAL